MLLTLSKPPKSEFEFKTPHDYSPPFTSSAPRFSPKLPGGLFRSLPASAPSTMGTPHRGLPPPAAMTMQDPGRGPPPLPPSMGSMPAPPSQWQGAEESMRNWLVAKAEEDKRKQEEEKTRQEGLRLEQRKIEQSMLQESLARGIPPNLVPMIFAGISGSNLANMSLDWLQQYVAQLQAAQQQQQQQALAQAQVSPELRRETRLIGQTQPGVYGVAPQGSQPVLSATSVLPGQPLAAQPQHGAFSTSAARAAQTSGHVGAPTSAPRPPAQSQLPRLTTNEMQIQQPPSAPLGVHALQQQSQPSQETSSPSIYFHHWVPPTSQSGGTERREAPATPSGKHHASFSHHQHAASHASDADYTSSPKKRKAVGGHQQAPPPSSTPQYTSPSFSQISSSASTPARRGHGRARSDASTRGYDAGGPLSRRATISSQALPEGIAPPVEHGGPEQRQPQPSRGPESQQQQQQGHPLQHQYQAHEQHRNEGSSGMQGTSQGETRQSQHQHSVGPERRSAPGSPKREAGAQ
ncbi:uncharacterized protein BDZ99DRAFT_455216 [Mytilinidion resinicola]|uniref:Uncharacterized protein n=1 Tax=Mytilinidion resinicola TaxID=574789 RepID=A0A6A6Y0K8_9PEZI|nr:uncharacterized protein BDZ99DRAFT_455216 [Mytilinidion resinicola]KAF2802088.1 hypothetical protein BDZ99DRAFT_455216 [Mytilinidion resinicola]